GSMRSRAGPSTARLRRSGLERARLRETGSAERSPKHRLDGKEKGKEPGQKWNEGDAFGGISFPAPGRSPGTDRAKRVCRKTTATGNMGIHRCHPRASRLCPLRTPRRGEEPVTPIQPDASKVAQMENSVNGVC